MAGWAGSHARCSRWGKRRAGAARRCKRVVERHPLVESESESESVLRPLDTTAWDAPRVCVDAQPLALNDCCCCSWEDVARADSAGEQWERCCTEEPYVSYDEAVDAAQPSLPTVRSDSPAEESAAEKDRERERARDRDRERERESERVKELKEKELREKEQREREKKRRETEAKMVGGISNARMEDAMARTRTPTPTPSALASKGEGKISARGVGLDTDSGSESWRRAR